MKIFLTGAQGQLGKELQKRLQGTDFLPTDVNELDITDESAVLQMIGRYRPDVVIHGAADGVMAWYFLVVVLELHYQESFLISKFII